MPKKSYIEQYIEKKAKKDEIINYELINKAFKKCEFCNRLFHPQGIYKHKMYCQYNPNRKTNYKTKRKWRCRYCGILFMHNKERNLHESRCIGNPEVIIINSKMSNKDKLNLFRREFPEIYELLNPNQIKKFLDNEIKN